MDKVNVALVIGLGHSGLFVTRQLANLTDKIYGIGRNDDIGLYSRFYKNGRCFIAYSIDDICVICKQIYSLERVKPKLFLCSDQYLTLILNHIERLSNYIDFSNLDIEALSLINDKQIINKFCTRCSINIPFSLSLNDFINSQDKQFPVIIKWRKKELDQDCGKIGKPHICNDKNQFEELLNTMEGIAPENLIVQKYIRGDNGNQYSVGGYYKNGEKLANVVVRQIKQYPQGVSAEVYSVEDGIAVMLDDVSMKFVKELNYTGFLEMEYKIDNMTGKYYLLDINPRPWGWVSILGAVYKDFYKCLIGQRPECEYNRSLWKSPLRCLKARNNKQNYYLSAQESLSNTAYDIYDKNDLKPLLLIVYVLIKKILRR